MKKPITIPIPYCKKCKVKLEPHFTTEKEEGDITKPEIIIVYGVCDKCEVVTITSLIQTKDLPSCLEELEEYAESKKSKKERKK